MQVVNNPITLNRRSGVAAMSLMQMLLLAGAPGMRRFQSVSPVEVSL